MVIFSHRIFVLLLSTALPVSLVSCEFTEVNQESSHRIVEIPVAQEATLDIYSVSPDVGALDGGTRIRIYGKGFQPGAKVRVGGVLCKNVKMESDAVLSCETPGADTISLANVEVFNSDGSRGQLDYAFSYVEARPRMPAGKPGDLRTDDDT